MADSNPVEGPKQDGIWQSTTNRIGDWFSSTGSDINKVWNTTTPMTPIPKADTGTSLRDREDTGTSSPTTQQAISPDGSAITVQSREGGGDILDLSAINWRANPLSKYQNLSYHITWSACRDLPDIRDYQSYVSARNANEEDNRFIIIAQTGSTKYNINSLVMESRVGPGPVTRNSFQTAITMEITEPFGMSLLDTLKNAAEVLGNANFGKTYYFLEIHFTAYDENGVIVSDDISGPGFSDDEGMTDRKQHGFYLLKVVPLSIEPTISESGSTYRITMMPMNELAFTDSNYRLQAPLKCSGKTTEQALNSLAEKLNEEVKIRNLGRQITRYNFVIEDSALKTYQMKTDDPFKTHDSDVGNNGDPEHQSSTGLEIGAMIDAIYLNSTLTDFWQAKLENPEKDADQLKNIIRVYPEVHYTDYDYVNDDYIREITYHIYSYDTLRPIVSSDSFKSDNAKSSTLLGKMVTGNLLRKRYDYIFTGRNTEVLNFDIRFNLNWSAVVNAFNGARRGYAASAEAPLHNEGMAEQIYNLDTQLGSSLIIIENFLSQSGEPVVMDSTGSQTDLTAELDRLKATRRELYDLNAAYTGGARAGYEEKLAILTDLTRDIVERANTLEAQRRKTVYDALGKTDTGERRFRRFAEDISNRTNRDIVMPITVRRSSEDFASRYGTGSLGDWNVGKSVMGAVLNQVYGPMEKDLQRITMDVRGDPYWFGSSNMDSKDLNAGSSLADYPLFQYGDHCILVSFRYPTSINPDTGDMTLSGSESFNGIYAVTQITHHLANGVFKQTLQANRLPVIALGATQSGSVTSGSKGTSVAPKLTSASPTAIGGGSPPVQNLTPSIAPSLGESSAMARDALLRVRDQEAEVDTQLSIVREENYQLLDKIRLAQTSSDQTFANSLRKEQAIVAQQIRDLEARQDTLANERSALLQQVK